MSVEESNLPGVGKMFAVDIGDERELRIVIHNTGKREVYLKEEPDADSEKLFELSDRLARTIGTILDGSYFQPVSMERIETKLDKDSVLEWVDVCETSPAVGKTVEELEALEEFDISIIAIRRNKETIANITSDTKIKQGDKLIVIEPEKGHGKLTEICKG
ncbi:hypothetical protein AKJ36_03550 [candidate division MSBL1 archaeon SCGC-AAA259I07]|uniref:RCK C-terminal domain-containing protein n=1 Tax=candidate division MSBL1 archaeon SCGC-AAA259I07 TaxID=1698266 RepID=A0A133UIT8_9EURY|nr:hypothetical protein AKJ36_03550 [candidate division MSBL1 archaeon SCGC-AAA259I07]